MSTDVMPERKQVSLDELAQRAGNGLVCQCGSNNWKVLYTLRIKGTVRRRRECLVCHRRKTTDERFLGG